MNYTYTPQQLVKETILEMFDEDGRLTSREVTKEYSSVPQAGWWQNPVISHNTEWSGDPKTARVII